MAGSWERRGDSVRMTVDVGKDFTGKRDRRRKTVPYVSDRKAAADLAIFYTECTGEAVVYSGKITVSALCDKYLEVVAKGNVKKSTYSGYESIVRSSIKPLLGAHKAEKVTTLHIQEWIKYLMENGAPETDIPKKNNHKKKKTKKGVSAKSIYNRFALLGNIFEAGVEWGMLKKNPCARAKLPKYKKPEADSYNQVEVAELIKKLVDLDDELYLTFKTAIMIDLFSGLRKGELVGLQWDKIDMDTGAYRIDATRLYTPGDGTYTDNPKTDSGVRDLTFPAFCVDLLSKLKQQQRIRKVALGGRWGPDDGFVFLNDTGQPMGISTLYKQFIRFLDREGLRRIKLHTLRHTNASMIHSLNLNLSEISKWMGHSKISTTTDIYTHLFNNDSKKDIADKLQEAFVPIVSPQTKTNA